MKKISVLFVCLGNICRSPLAEGIFKDKIRKKGLESYFTVDSCGTSNYHIGDSPDPRTIANALKNGVVLEHCGRQLSVKDLDDFDYILAMDKSNLQNILRLTKDSTHHQKITLMRTYDSLSPGGEVPDPYYGSETHFQEVFDILDRTMENFINQLVQKHLSKIIL
jgi:protein-tyrosine phosphatase